jgi:hypothetical protein
VHKHVFAAFGTDSVIIIFIPVFKEMPFIFGQFVVIFRVNDSVFAMSEFNPAKSKAIVLFPVAQQNFYAEANKKCRHEIRDRRNVKMKFGHGKKI